MKGFSCVRENVEITKKQSLFGYASALYQEEKEGRIEAMDKSFYLQRNKYGN